MDGAPYIEPHKKGKNLKKSEFLLNHSKFIWEKIKLQREVTDRYFYYYLLFITSPIVALAAVLNNKSIGVTHSIIAIVCLLLFSIGFCFFCLYIRQRINRLRLGHELNNLAAQIASLQDVSANQNTDYGIIVNGLTAVGAYSADFWVNTIQAIINTFWLVTGSYLLMSIYLYDYAAIPFAALAGVVCLIIKYTLMDFWLHKFEAGRAPLKITKVVYKRIYRIRFLEP